MSIAFNSECMLCHLRRNVETAKKLGTPEQTTAFAKRLMELYLSAPEDVASPWFGPATSDLFHEMYGLDRDRFRQEKEDSNCFVLERMDQIRRRIEAAPDPVYAGAQFSVLGNYIDFSALQGEVSFEQLDELLLRGESMKLDLTSYHALQQDLENGKELLYLTDNAGEIGFDRLFAEQISRKYPQLNITFCVRGSPILNDATREDALRIGIPFPIIDNGNRVAGTQISLLSREASDALNRADVVIAKGQANVETMYGCGYNVYYAFLIKCSRFIELFGRPKFTPMLLRERS